MAYFGNSVDTQPVIAETAGAAIENGAFRAVKYDANGAVVPVATAGEQIAGVVVAETEENIAIGGDVTVQVSGTARMLAGGAIKKGEIVAVDALGKAVKAVTNNTIIGIAREAGAAGDILRVQLMISGAKA